MHLKFNTFISNTNYSTYPYYIRLLETHLTQRLSSPEMESSTRIQILEVGWGVIAFLFAPTGKGMNPSVLLTMCK